MIEAMVRYLMAKLRFDTIDRERDRLLAPIDVGMVTALSEREQKVLGVLNQELSAAYDSLLAAEEALPPSVREQLKRARLVV
jgi:hypothetical protein